MLWTKSLAEQIGTYLNFLALLVCFLFFFFSHLSAVSSLTFMFSPIYSHGQMQLLAIGRAMLSPAKIIIMDESTLMSLNLFAHLSQSIGSLTQKKQSPHL